MTEETHDSKLLGWSFLGPYLNLGAPNCESKSEGSLGDTTKFCRSSKSGRVKGHVGKTPRILDVTKWNSGVGYMVRILYHPGVTYSERRRVGLKGLAGGFWGGEIAKVKVKVKVIPLQARCGTEGG